MPLSPSGTSDKRRASAHVKAPWIDQHVYAHRGLHGAGIIENTRSAFAAAIARGLGIECDIQRSRDDVPMVFHDWNLQRLLNRPEETAMLTAGELQALRFPGLDEAPLTLAELLALVAGRVPLLIEIKSRKGYDVERTCVRVHDTLQGYSGNHAVMSFDPRVSRWFARHSAATVRGLVVTEEGAKGWCGAIRRSIALWHAQADFLAYDVRDLPSRFAARQRARGMPVVTWTVRNQEQRTIAALHADAPIAEGAGIEAVA